MPSSRNALAPGSWRGLSRSGPSVSPHHRISFDATLHIVVRPPHRAYCQLPYIGFGSRKYCTPNDAYAASPCDRMP